MNELYETLGLKPDATEDEIKKAYRAKARETHPDHGGDVDQFKLVSLAGTVLTDPDKRKRYDETGCADSDTPISGAQKIVAELVNQAMLQMEMPDNPIRWMQEQIDALRTKLRSVIAGHERKLKRLNDRLEKFTKTNTKSKNKPAVTMITSMLRSAIDIEQREMTEATENLDYAEQAMVFLNDLQYPAAGYSVHQSSFSSMNSGWSWERWEKR